MKLIKFAAIAAVLLLLIPLNSNASLFTMNFSQLSRLYTVYSESSLMSTPDAIHAIRGSFLYNGSMDPGGKIMIGANYHGAPSNIDLGMNSLEGFSGYTMKFRNLSEHALHYNLYFNVGYTGESSEETDYYIETSWTMIDAGGTANLVLDFDNVSV